MLADDILADRQLVKLFGSGYALLASDLRRAHRIDLDTGFTAAADELGASRPSAFTAVIPLCRPPDDPTWIETAQSYGPASQSQAALIVR